MNFIDAVILTIISVLIIFSARQIIKNRKNGTCSCGSCCGACHECGEHEKNEKLLKQELLK